MFLEVFSKFLPVLSLFLLGYVFKVKRYISETTFGEIKKLLVNIFLPSLLFIAFSNTQFEAKHLVIVISMFFICLLLLTVGILFSVLYKVKSRYYYLLFTGFEAGMLGYSLFTVFYGVENVVKFAVVDLGQVIFVFLVMVGILTGIKENKNSYKISNLFFNFIKTPVVIAILSGIIFQRTGITNIFSKNILLQSIMETIKMLSQLTVPFISLTIGYELKLGKENFGFVIKTVLTRSLILLILGLLVNKFLIIELLKLDGVFQKAILTMFLLPAPFVIPLYMKEEDKNTIANVLAFNTIITMILFLVINLIFR